MNVKPEASMKKTALIPILFLFKFERRVGGYGAKELERENGLMLHDHGARLQDPQLGRFTSVDQLANNYHDLSPYLFCAANPLRFTDPTGMELKPDETKDSSYNGSGWGHSIRTLVRKDLFNLKTEVNNVVETAIMSLLQADEVIITGQALEKIKKDPAILELEKSLCQKAINNAEFGKRDFEFKEENNHITFGGKRAPESMSEQAKRFWSPKYKDTWKVATNELTWLVRNVYIDSNVSVSANGLITIAHSFEDFYDLRPQKNRNNEYNLVTTIFGFLYHDIIGGNDMMKVSASWEKKYKHIKK